MPYTFDSIDAATTAVIVVDMENDFVAEGAALQSKQALAMVDDGRIADAKTVLLLQWAALRGPFRD